jgi:hypothetical protein
VCIVRSASILLCSCVLLYGQAPPARNVQLEGVIGDGATDITAALQHVFDTARNGDTILFPAGTYLAKKQTEYFVTQPIRIAGNGAILRNIRLFFLADVELNGVTLQENDCIHDPVTSSACPALGAMITLGYVGHPIHHASLHNLTLDYTRAYTGIDMGYGDLENVTIDNFKITDRATSGISIYGGKTIRISNGTIHGGDQPQIDDGIAISPSYGPISDVAISDVVAEDTFDLVGIGAQMFFPMSGIKVNDSSCRRTAACLYLKPGEDGDSTLDGVTIDGITDEDPGGVRYLTSIFFVGRHASVARNIQISRVSAYTRNHDQAGFRVKIYLNQTARLENLALSQLSMIDAAAGGASDPGFPPLEGMYVQTDGTAQVNGLSLRDSQFDGVSLYGVDARAANVTNLQISNLSFLNMHGPSTTPLPKGQ